jgi:DNA mismatch repair ATPase MutL
MIMRAFRFLHLAILSVLVATSAAVYAQDEKPQEEKPKQEEPKRQEEARPTEKRDEARPTGKQDEMKAPRQDEAKPAKQDKNDQKEMEKSRDQNEGRQNEGRQNEGRQQRQEAGQQEHGRPAGKSGHIPDDKFRSQFGRGHAFHPSRPQIVNGQPQFVYGGYNFVMVDVWPADWAYTDDCYIDYVDGEYFLFDLLHPGMRIALFVVM